VDCSACPEAPEEKIRIVEGLRGEDSMTYPPSEKSYDASITDANRQAGVYIGRILSQKREAGPPAGSAVHESRVDSSAKALGLTFPLPLIGRADEEVE
jgi:hypothetical protein